MNAVACLRRLLDDGADPTARNAKGQGPLLVAASRGNSESCVILALELAKRNASLDAFSDGDAQGRTFNGTSTFKSEWRSNGSATPSGLRKTS